MGLSNKSRRTKILNATSRLSNMLFSKTMDLSQSKKITKYEQDVLLWILLGARSFVDNLLIQEGYPLNKVSDNQLGEGNNTLEAYSKMAIFLLHVHEERLKNKKELQELADTSINDIGNTLRDLLTIEEKSYVKDYMNHLKEVQSNKNNILINDMYHQMVQSAIALMADGESVEELFEDPTAKIFLPMAFNIQLIEHSESLDKLLGLK